MSNTNEVDGNTSAVWENHITVPETPKGFTVRTTYPNNPNGAEVMLERWEAGSEEPPHSHPHVQTSYIASGEIIFYCEGEPDQHLKAGDMFEVPSGKLHTIKLLTEKARLVDSFSPIREDFL